jgi:hypothetical protein
MPDEAALHRILEATQEFLRSSRQPVLIEPGEEPLELAPENFCLDLRQGRLLFQAWDRERMIVRRLVALKNRARGRLELGVERFGKRQGAILLYDQARGVSPERRRGARLVFRELFRRSLRRQFPGWRLADLSTEPDLEHSLSPSFPRALLTRGVTGWAAIAAPPESAEPAGALSFGLIWLDYLRRRERRLTIEGLAIFVPEGRQNATCLRLRYLNPELAQYALFVYSPEGYEERLDPSDSGNLDTRLEPCPAPPPGASHPLAARLSRLDGVETVPAPDGGLSFRIRGLELARWTGSELVFGLTEKQAATLADWPRIEALAGELARWRSPEAADRYHPLFLRAPEAWLESQVRASLRTIDPLLEPAPVYGQVLAFAGVERGIIDLLAVDAGGRLAVLELKATADLHLPLQALDYWMRIRWHLERDEFRTRGYFPSRRLARQTPRLLLIAPALEFHPTSEILLQALSPEVPVERIGLAADWRRQVRVLFHLRGAARPELAPISA